MNMKVKYLTNLRNYLLMDILSLPNLICHLHSV